MDRWVVAAVKNSVNANGAPLLQTPTVQLDLTQKHICLLEIKATGGKKESKWAKPEREGDKAQKESLSAANTDTVMHQDLTACLRHSFECSILHMDTLCCVCVLTRLTAQPGWSMKTCGSSSSDQKEKINIPVSVSGEPVSPEVSLHSCTRLTFRFSV